MNQREVRRPAADVADQNPLPEFDMRLPVVAMAVDPRIEGCLRFFDQNNLRQPRRLCRRDGQFTSHLIERGRNRQDDVLLFERIVRMLRVPGVSNVADVSRADFYRRERLHVSRSVPGKQCRSTINSGVTQPGFCRRDQPSGHGPSVVACEDADAELRFFIFGPRQSQSRLRKFPCSRLVVKRRQRFTPFDLSGCD